MKTYKSLHKKSDCLLLHRLETNHCKSTSVTEYKECRDCGHREVITLDGIYQPVDFTWLGGRK